jgi:hypothetical protein
VTAARAEGGAVALPSVPVLVAADVVEVTFVAQATSEDRLAVDALNLEPAFGQVAASLELGVLAAHLSTFPLALPF